MKTPPPGTAHGTLRWYVHRRAMRLERFGETRPQIKWVVQPIVHGTGSKGLPMGAPTICNDRAAALADAHHQATRTYGPKDSRP